MIGAALRFCRDNMIAEASEGSIAIVGFRRDERRCQQQQFGRVSDEMKAAGITVYHIHVGTDSVPPDVMEIANATGGESFVATDESGLRRIFKHIDRMKPARFKPATAIPMDFFQPFAMTGLALLGCFAACAFGWRYTPW